MADFNIASQIQPFQAPNVLGVAEHVQKMQTSNMLMQQRAAELQKENALRAAAAQYGVNSKAYAEAAGRIDPEAGLKAFTYQRQMQAAGASAAAAARAAELDRIRADTATVDLVNKHGARFEQALRMVDTTENPAATYDKLYSILPPSLKPLYPDKYSPDAVQRALMTNAEVVAAAAPAKPTIYPGTADMPMQAYVPGKGNTLGTTMIVPETPMPGAVNQLMPPTAAAAVPGVNQLAPSAAAPAIALTPSQVRAQAQAAKEVPKDYRMGANGAYEPIPGGPADPAVIEAKQAATTRGTDTTKAAIAQDTAKIAKKEVGDYLLRTLGGEGGDKIESLINASTSGRAQKWAAEAKGAFGTATPGMENIGTLDHIAKQMTFDLLNGKLGAGISNADRDFISGLVADIANPNIPANERIRGFRQLKNTVNAWASGKDVEIGAPAGATTPKPLKPAINGRAISAKPLSGTVDFGSLP